MDKDLRVITQQIHKRLPNPPKFPVTCIAHGQLLIPPRPLHDGNDKATDRL